MCEKENMISNSTADVIFLPFNLSLIKSLGYYRGTIAQKFKTNHLVAIILQFLLVARIHLTHTTGESQSNDSHYRVAKMELDLHHSATLI